jgi:hypothetical protein
LFFLASFKICVDENLKYAPFLRLAKNKIQNGRKKIKNKMDGFKKRIFEFIEFIEFVEFVEF